MMVLNFGFGEQRSSSHFCWNFVRRTFGKLLQLLSSSLVGVRREFWRPFHNIRWLLCTLRFSLANPKKDKNTSSSELVAKTTF